MTDEQRASRSPGAWAGRLQELASRSLQGTPLLGGPADEAEQFIASFRDDAGHRRAVDPLLLSWMLTVKVAEPAEPGPAEALWLALLDENAAACATSPDGPLFPAMHDGPIEAWTEAELCGLHAIWWLARRRRMEAERVNTAIAWHLAEVQPDNGTGHPWAVQAFICHWCEYGDSAALLHAETMLHACTVHGPATGTPDRFSACILLDAARGLDEIAQSG